MTYRKAAILRLLPIVFLLAHCATYVPPPPVPQSSFSRDIPASYDRTWSAITYVAGASFYKIKAFEKASGLMTLEFDLNDVSPYVDCGTVVSKSTGVAEPAIHHLLLDGLSLTGTANISVRAEGGRKTAVQFNSQYELVGFRNDGYGFLRPVIAWKFTTGSSATAINFGQLVTCRPSYKIEEGFLTEIAARI